MCFIFSSPSFSSANARCERFLDDCEYYSCLSTERNCRKDDYPENFGKKYCLRYKERRGLFSMAGRTWMDKVRKCLIHEMMFFENSLTCSELKARAFSGHVQCYYTSGFCELSNFDKRQVFQTIWPSLIETEVWENGRSILDSCMRRGPEGPHVGQN